MHLLRLAVIILAHGPLGVQAKQLACGQSAFGRCECKSNFIDCRARMLKEVPVSMTPNAEVVDLDLNQIQVIGECDFRGLDLLVELSLYKNQIHSIHIKAFEHLYRLRVLNLRKNSLTILDVNNLNVHHLSSLDTLYLRGNQIVMIDKYTLLSAVMFKFNIEMDNSMIPCDCYLREMRETFLAFSTDLTPYFSGIFCVDGPERFPMLDAAVSVFGQCPATRRTHAFNDVSTACMTCSQAETNHECQLSGTTLCTKPQNACQTVLEWDGESLSISSRCLGYRDCLMAEFTNSQTCVNSSTLFCKFCAFGTMCSNSTPMAGRTLDVNYNLTYAKFKHDFTEDLKDRNSPKFLDFQNNVALALKEITSSLPRGINSRVVSCELVRGKELHVLVNFDLTVINAYSHDAVKNALLKELQLHLHKEGGFFHRENTDVTTVYLWDQ
ncbi:uncharacterized protein LOC131931263, partial [Physella acuta]|uniref:uncharacterized protein LOC131931263 n=1 Tax=Physella acuta TaxID=109671 RepID=UPI0027DB7C2A